MKKWSMVVAISAVGLAMTIGATGLRADDGTAKGPADAYGTLPALTKIAGEATMNSHAFGVPDGLSDDIGARVTGSPVRAQG